MKKYKKLALFMMVCADTSVDASCYRSLFTQSKNISKAAVVAAGCMIASQKPAHAELLIVKKDENGLASLDQHDAKKYGPTIAKTLLKYQWPMCTSQDLTDQEKKDLLSADKPCGEEIFIQSKLQQEIGAENFDPQVIFIPTTLYELFCIDYIENQLTVEDKRFLCANVSDDSMFNAILGMDEDATTIKSKIHDYFMRINKRYFEDDKNRSLLVNQACIEMLLEIYPELKNCKDAVQASQCIQEKSQELSAKLFKKIDNITDAPKSGHDIVVQMIQLEYEAREQNKALLTRGAKCISHIDFTNDNVTNVENKELLGSTIQEYKKNKREIDPYSISFGNSLYAGYFNDKGACADDFLARKIQPSANKVVGYVLFVDKEDYMKDRNFYLFFIPSLSSIASLNAQGEFFHPRATAAILMKNNEIYYIRGIGLAFIKDSAEILLIERDPLLHAELFSDYVAKNGTIIHRVDDENLTQEEKEAAQQILANQAIAAEFYRKKRELPSMPEALTTWEYLVSYFYKK